MDLITAVRNTNLGERKGMTVPFAKNKRLHVCDPFPDLWRHGLCGINVKLGPSRLTCSEHPRVGKPDRENCRFRVSTRFGVFPVEWVKKNDFYLQLFVLCWLLIWQCLPAFQLPIRWTAPEAFRSEGNSIRADVWSFGVLTYEVVTFGWVPYAGKGYVLNFTTICWKFGACAWCTLGCKRYGFSRLAA